MPRPFQWPGRPHLTDGHVWSGRELAPRPSTAVSSGVGTGALRLPCQLPVPLTTPHPGPRSPPSLPPPLPATPAPPQAALSSWFASWSKTVVALGLRPRPDSVISSSSDPVGLTFRSRWAALQPAWGVARRSHVPSWPLSASPGPTQAVRPRARICAFKIRSFSASKPPGSPWHPAKPCWVCPLHLSAAAPVLLTHPPSPVQHAERTSAPGLWD